MVGTLWRTTGFNIKLIKDWIRPLQKSLTLETENKFTNILGKKNYFNDYLYQSLTKLDYLNLPDEYFKLFNQFSKRFREYNSLDFNQRKRLIIDTRKSLYKLGKNIDSQYSNKLPNLTYLSEIDSTLSLKSDISLVKKIGRAHV